MPSYPAAMAMLSLLPLAMRMAGPREALWHAIIRKNSGVSHLIVGRDHAGPEVDRRGRPFYPPAAAQELLRRHEAEPGITMVPFQEMVYVEDLDRYVPRDEVPAGARTRSISGAEQRRHLREGRLLPAWFTPPAVAAGASGNGGAAIWAIAPYDAARRQVRAMVEREVGFVLVHVATPVGVCGARDRKGQYAKAHAGLLRGFTGVSELSAEQAADRVLAHLQAEGYLPGAAAGG